MILKTIKITDVSLLNFFYPDYKIVTSLTPDTRNKKIIYAGSMVRDLQKILSRHTSKFISTVGVPDPEYDFTNRLNFLKWVYKTHNKEVPKKLIETIDYYDQDYFISCIKHFYVIGKWEYLENTDTQMFSLYNSTNESLRENLQSFYQVLDTTPDKIVEASLLTFLGRVCNIDEQNVNPSYLRLLKSSRMKYGKKIKQAVFNYGVKNHLSTELGLFDLLTDLRNAL